MAMLRQFAFTPALMALVVFAALASPAAAYSERHTADQNRAMAHFIDGMLLCFAYFMTGENWARDSARDQAYYKKQSARVAKHVYQMAQTARIGEDELTKRMKAFSDNILLKLDGDISNFWTVANDFGKPCAQRASRPGSFLDYSFQKFGAPLSDRKTTTDFSIDQLAE